MGIISRDLNLESSEASVRKAAEARLQVPPLLYLKLNFFFLTDDPLNGRLVMFGDKVCINDVTNVGLT